MYANFLTYSTSFNFLIRMMMRIIFNKYDEVGMVTHSELIPLPFLYTYTPYI